jgi:hypothetical protein
LRVAEQDLRVCSEELVLVGGGEFGCKRTVVEREGIQNNGAAKDVGIAAEGLGQGCKEDVSVRENIDIAKASNGVVNNQDEAILLGL